MRSLIFLVVLALGLVNAGCRKNGDDAGSGTKVCGVSKPLTNLPWLKKKVDSLKAEGLNGFVRSYDYQGQQIISVQSLIQSCYPCTLYTCSGKALSYERDSTIINNVMENITN